MIEITPHTNLEQLNRNKRITLSRAAPSLRGSWLDYLGRLTKKPLTFRFMDEEQSYQPADDVVLSPCFFRDFVCPIDPCTCTKCCERYSTSLFYTHPEITANDISLDELIALGFSPMLVHANQGEVSSLSAVYVSLWNIVDGGRCPWLTADGCSIHEVKPIQCWLSPIHVDCLHRGGKTKMRLTKRMPGRYTRVGCVMTRMPATPASLVYDLKKLHKLQAIADQFKLETWLPELTILLTAALDPEHLVWKQPLSEGISVKKGVV